MPGLFSAHGDNESIPMVDQPASTAKVGDCSVVLNGSTSDVAAQGVSFCHDRAVPMPERLTQSLLHSNEDHTHASSRLPHLSMVTYRDNEESASDTPDESPQPRRLHQRKRK
ncbi:hypothetical protein PC116_g16333 [Phytophthora cactorum]|uniref:Uncharacterized protein n=1 Tax=Phytophthora cactorum TaxID=29920 RepID=A0A8T1KEN1_9STRA|nr:hypothetical protein PC117_g13099 [Phytophthora cactorum]KAG3006096.1 hypothetical protein PC120_g17587 [Phytophthora cactorum]KAG3011006.1 hypothetical protein PC119_g13349 [Phytophthora cactorum]KAG3160785.1 hypothetical protein PC128_g20961 [Phytophthora cactorum]KAG4046740.1 hypothetical protein PC123_g17885 [Phytophthora cactorum]